MYYRIIVSINLIMLNRKRRDFFCHLNDLKKVL